LPLTIWLYVALICSFTMRYVWIESGAKSFMKAELKRFLFI